MAPSHFEGSLMPRGPLPINTYGRRRDEVLKWKNHAWYEILYKLESTLSTIDRDYEIVQIKDKFGGLRFYISSDSPRRAEMNEYIRQAEIAVDKLEHQKRVFDKAAIPPSQEYEGIKW